ncbi:1,4-dihydroxy-2-naphthoate octaprenyltransferase [Sutterella sp.]|uniref:1,4-dihydroxy-2-naphthoate octaprenyltransferase n=1 Tax=Sutterella sp. TaxID=1981025 RepID=UPI003FD6DE13
MSEARSTDHPGVVKAWLAFTRPKTWIIAAAPVAAALGLAWGEAGVFHPLTAFFTLTIAVLMQAVSNMQNDLGYAERKAERGNRRGLPRATTMGWISLPTARIAVRAGAVLALLNTAVLIWLGGWVFALIGLASLAAAYCYMGGPKPVAYTPFGELMVLVFFGLTAVCGTYYLQTASVSANAVLLGAALGAIASGVLAVNNFRDIEHDASIDRRTLAVVLGRSRFLIVFALLMALPYAALITIAATTPALWPTLAALASLPKALAVVKALPRREHEALNEVMFACVKLEGLYALLFAAGAAVAGFIGV